MVDALGVDSCIACTRIAVDTLREFGVRAQPVAVQVNIHYATAAAHITDGTPEAIADDPEAWTFQLGFGPFELGDDIYNGHVVCVVEGRLLLDLTLGQANRPEHGVRLGPSVFGPLQADFLKGAGQVFSGAGGCVVAYQPHPAKRGYFALPHSTDRSFSRPFVSRIVTSLR